MRRLFIAGNWKMNSTLSSTRALTQKINESAGNIENVQLAVFPPNVYLSEISDLLDGSTIRWGAQNLSDQDAGAFTGEVSASMLLDFHCSYSLVGHSERRTLYGESDTAVANKFSVARKAGLIPVLCVGESLEEREQGMTEAVVERQIKQVLEQVGIQGFDNAVIAYEPIWAIGTGKTATATQAQDVHAFIRSKLAEHDPDIANKTQILYGGSVKGSIAGELFAMPDIDGGLVGGASLDAGEFQAIVEAAQSHAEQSALS